MLAKPQGHSAFPGKAALCLLEQSSSVPAAIWSLNQAETDQKDFFPLLVFHHRYYMGEVHSQESFLLTNVMNAQSISHEVSTWKLCLGEREWENENIKPCSSVGCCVLLLTGMHWLNEVNEVDPFQSVLIDLETQRQKGLTQHWQT